MLITTSTEQVFEQINQYTAELPQLFEELIDNYKVETEELNSFKEILLYSLLAPSKKLRAYIIIRLAETLAANHQAALQVASTIEIIHSFSLIHDDLPALDNDDMRRGQPSCHKQFGEDVAILAGDCLNNIAFEALFSSPLNSYPDSLNKLIKLLLEATSLNGMIGGQYLDITTEANITLPQLEICYRLKTGKLFGACFAASSILASQSQALVKKWQNFGEEFGVFFQLTDDWIGSTSTTEQLGKTAQIDNQNDKPNLLSIFSQTDAKHYLSEYEEKLHAELASFNLLDQSWISDLIWLVSNRNR